MRKMKIKILELDFSICKIRNLAGVNYRDEIFFISKTEDGVSLVCPTKSVPANKSECSNGWKALKINEVLALDNVAVVASITSILANENIPIFVAADYTTYFILVKEQHLIRAIKALCDAGYQVR